MARNALAADGRGARRRRVARRDHARPRGVSRRGRDASSRCHAAAAARSCSTTPTTPIPIRCAPRSTCSPRRPAPRCLVLGDMGEVGAHGPAFHREIGAYARERGIDAAVRARRRWRAKPSPRSARVRRTSTRRRGAGRRSCARDAQARRRRCSSRARASCGWSAWWPRSPAAAEGGALMLLLLVRMARAVRARVQRVRLHHAARGARDDDRARDLVPDRPAHDRVAVADEDRPVGARRRPADASRQGRHADDGRRADPGVDRASPRCCGATSPTASCGSCCS